MDIRTKISSSPQISLKLVHTKGSVTQLHNVKEYKLYLDYIECSEK